MANEKSTKKKTGSGTGKKSKEFIANQGSFAKRSPEERKMIASKGGKARAKKIAAQKSLGQLAKTMMSSSIKKEDVANLIENVPDIEADDMTIGALIVYGQIRAAIEGNPKAFEQLLALEGATEKQAGQEDKLTQALKEVSKLL